MKLGTNENKLFMNFVENNDFDSFDELFNLTSPWLYKCIYRLVSNKQIAEDILQESWTILIEHKDSFNPDKGKFNSLIFTIAKNLAFKELSKTKDGFFVKNSHFVDSTQSNDNNPEEILQIQERNFILNSTILKLKKDYQDIVLMYYYGDMSIKEIANELSLSESTVRTNLSRARNKIETILKNDSKINLNVLLDILMVVKL